METAEILIVFSALMALIAVVTIGIDWIGKPLKHRRFIPRMYRFEDEKLPVDAYGHTTLTTIEPLTPSMTPVPPMHAAPVPPLHTQPRPVVVAQVPLPATQSVTHRSNATMQVSASPPARAEMAPTGSDPDRTPETGMAPDDVAEPGSRSAFSDSVAKPEAAPVAGVDPDAWLSNGLVPHSTIAGTEPTAPSEATPSTRWRPGMAIDTTVEGRKPNLATKAERFWMTTAESMSNSHFEPEDIARMTSGKAPRRTNPRTGRIEAMQLTGLRQASTHTEVRMRWPDESVDPWNAS